MLISPDLLYTLSGLQEVDNSFLDFLEKEDGDLCNFYKELRRKGETLILSSLDESNFLLELAPFVETFLAEFFQIKDDVFNLQKEATDLASLFQCRRIFVQRQVLKKISEDLACVLDGHSLEKEILLLLKKEAFEALVFSEKVLEWLKEPETYAHNLEISEKYVAWRFYTQKEVPLSLEDLLFQVPRKIDFQNLIETVQKKTEERRISPEFLKNRWGFDLTDLGKNSAYICGEAHYCIFCHTQGKDSCSKGFLKKRDQRDDVEEHKRGKNQDEEKFQKNPLGVTLKGCPLKQKISEMNTLISQGYRVGALAMIVIDNPLVAATGARICNDCMKSCIYQRQEAVDIPSIETETLKSVLNLPWGFEIYSLLTRWNPLNFRNVLPKLPTPHKILVVGMGPSGFTLSHYLLNQGHIVVGMDGLKIEPLPSSLVGSEQGFDFNLIPDVNTLFSNLSERVVGGFGGVMEYGITSRWNKNYLLLVRLLLERRKPQFTLLGGTRFGGAFDEVYASKLGFNHIALCLGAGAPRLLNLEKSLTKGIRQASDFLMTLHLGGACQKNSLANFVLRLPIIVLGGGLTAIDTATEAQAYYKTQVQTFLMRYEALVKKKGKEAVQELWSLEDKEIAHEFIEHGMLLREEEKKAEQEKRIPNFQRLIQSWGGVLIAYRRSLEESPAYCSNAEELKKALEEGIGFLENVAPLSLGVGQMGWLSEITFQKEEKLLTFPVKSILVAYGTRPNTSIMEDGEVSLPLKEGKLIPFIQEEFLERDLKDVYAPIICRLSENLSISFLGDLNPEFSGSVVKAMASAKEGAPFINKLLKKRTLLFEESPEDFSRRLRNLFDVHVIGVQELAPKILEITLHAPFLAGSFRPGQFFRLQRFETFSPVVEGEHFSMEGIALTGASVCPQSLKLSLIVLEVGVSTKLCRLFKKGEKVSLMGPTGTPTLIPSHKTVLLIGGGLGNAVLFSVGKALRLAHSRVLYVAGYKSLQDRFKVEEIEEASDVVLWCIENLSLECNILKRSQDFLFKGKITEGLVAYASGALGKSSISLAEVDYILTVGSQGMMSAVSLARDTILKSYLSSKHKAYGSINIPMQCMMKGICAQCLQRHQDPITGLETIVFSCRNQDQCLDYVDFKCLQDRIDQNHLAERMAAHWGEFLEIV